MNNRESLKKEKVGGKGVKIIDQDAGKIDKKLEGYSNLKGEYDKE